MDSSGIIKTASFARSNSATNMIVKRGAFIVLEGVDKTGKSTQCKQLVENLRKHKLNVEYCNFPARETDIGQMINSYLLNKNNLCDEAIHLLFSANRWEKANDILKSLEQGQTVISDRYCYSGVAFSAAKGLDINWCKGPDVGLPRPDKVFFLTLPFDSIQQRNGFGDERYEVPEFQKKVFNTFEQLEEDNWEVVDASRSIEIIQNELLEKTKKLIDTASEQPIQKLWMDKY